MKEKTKPFNEEKKVNLTEEKTNLFETEEKQNMKLDDVTDVEVDLYDEDEYETLPEDYATPWNLILDDGFPSLVVPVEFVDYSRRKEFNQKSETTGELDVVFLHYFRGYFYQCSGSIDGCGDRGRNQQDKQINLKRFLKQLGRDGYANLTQRGKDFVSSIIINEIIMAVSSASLASAKYMLEVVKTGSCKELLTKILVLVKYTLERDLCAINLETFEFSHYYDFEKMFEINSFDASYTYSRLPQQYENNEGRNVAFRFNKNTGEQITTGSELTNTAYDDLVSVYMLSHEVNILRCEDTNEYLATAKLLNKNSYNKLLPELKEAMRKLLVKSGEYTKDEMFKKIEKIGNELNKKGEPFYTNMFKIDRDTYTSLYKDSDELNQREDLFNHAIINSIFSQLELKLKIENNRTSVIGIQVYNF